NARALRLGRARSFVWLPFVMSGMLLTAYAPAQTPTGQERTTSMAEGATVVLVRTRGPAGWVVAERRLAAELRSLQMDVVSESIVREVDERLPGRAQEYRAFVAVQVLRNGDRGLVRLWFAAQGDLHSGYQHVEVNLRNPEVVSRAVLPTVEAIYDRARISRVEVNRQEEETEGDETEEVCLMADVDCRPRLSLRLGAGPWIVTASEVTAFAGVIGARSRLWSPLALDYELTYQLLSGAEVPKRLTTILLFR